MSLRKPAILVGLFFLLFLAAMVAIGAQAIQLPTYQYYGQVLNVDEFLKLVEAEIPLRCTEIPTVGRYLADPAAPFNFVCFNTREELDAYIADVIAPEWERIAQENPEPPSPLTNVPASNLLLSDH